jgi:hypothetical protein
MKKVQTVIALFVLTAITALAQTPCAPHPSDPGATLVGSMKVSVDIAQGAVVSRKDGKKGTKCTAEQLICVWRTSNGGTDLIGDPATVRFSGTCLTDFPASDLFALIGQKAVAQALSSGYIKCGDGLAGMPAVRFQVATCVSKNGTGSSMTFGPCTTVQCVRAYTVSCPHGSSTPVISRAPADNSGCGATPPGCQSACDQDCPPSDGSSVQ